MELNGFEGNLDALLEQMGMNDPASRQRLQLISGLLNKGNATPESDSEEQQDAREKRRERARKRLRRLLREHEILLDLSAALGMCQACFGDIQTCKRCHGQGGPGFFAPDEEAFEDIVMPVLDAMGLVQADEPTNPESSDRGK